MYSISDSLKSIIHQNTRLLKPRITYVDIGELDLKYLQNWSIEANLNETNQFVWGAAPSKLLSLNLIKADNNFYKPSKWTDLKIKVEIGIFNTAEPYDGTENVDDDNNFTFIPLGIFKPAANGINETNLGVTLTCFDEMASTDYEVYGVESSFENVTLESLLNVFSLLYDCDFSNITADEKAQLISYETATNTSLREMIQWAAVALSAVATFDRNGKLCFIRQSSRSYDETIDRSDYYSLAYRENEATYIETFNAEQVFILEHEEENPYTGSFTISTESGITYSLQCPIFADSTKTQQALDNGAEEWVRNIIPFSCICAGMPHLDVGDIVRIEDRDGSYLNFGIARHSFIYQNQTLTSELECVAFDADEIVGGTIGQSVGQVVKHLQDSKTFIFENIKANAASISSLSADKLDATLANIDTANISTASISYLASQIVDADQIRAITANLGYLTSTEIASNYASLNYLNSSYATINQLNSSYATLANLQSSYAKIDLANISTAAMDKLFVQSGILTNATISTGSITGMLNSVNVNADKITAGTLSVNRLNIYDDENGIVYALNAQNVASADLGNLTTYEQTHQFHGNDIVANSITANKINVNELSAFTANLGTVTAGEISGTNAYINLVSGAIRLGSTADYHLQVDTDGLNFYNITTKSATISDDEITVGTNNTVNPTSTSSFTSVFGADIINSGGNNMVFGIGSTVTGDNNFAEGWNHNITQDYAHIEGIRNKAFKANGVYGNNCHIEGSDNIAYYYNGHIEGKQNISSASYTHIEGNASTVTGSYSHIEGEQHLVSGDRSHAEGAFNEVHGSYNHAEGFSNILNGDWGHSEGGGNTVNGNYSHAEGLQNNALGSYCHCEGLHNSNSTAATYNHLEGEGNRITAGSHNHTEGYYNLVSLGYYSHAEGYQNSVSNCLYCHIEGGNNVGNGDCAHVEGRGSTVTAANAHAQNYYTIADCENQTVIGSCNSTANSANYAFVVGNGSTDSRSNAMTVRWDGITECYGKVAFPSTVASNNGLIFTASNGSTYEAIGKNSGDVLMLNRDAPQGEPNFYQGKDSDYCSKWRDSSYSVVADMNKAGYLRLDGQCRAVGGFYLPYHDSSWRTGISATSQSSYTAILIGVGSAANRVQVGTTGYSNYVILAGKSYKLGSASGTTITSDGRLKKDITPLDKYTDFFMRLKPCSYKYKTGTSGRNHLGYVAQEVELALEQSGLTTQEFGGIVISEHTPELTEDGSKAAIEKTFEESGISEGDKEYGLIYSEFIALNTHMIQLLKKEVDELRTQNAALEGKLKLLEKNLK